jgi:hypothetical protein
MEMDLDIKISEEFCGRERVAAGAWPRAGAETVEIVAMTHRFTSFRVLVGWLVKNGIRGLGGRRKPEADPTAPHGRSRINLRESGVGAGDFAQLFAPQALLARCVLFLPSVPLAAAFEPVVTLLASTPL